MSAEKNVLIDAGKGKAIGPAETKSNPKSSGLSVLVVLAFSAIIGISLYFVFRGIAFLSPGYSWVDRIFATLLLIAECFLFIHTIGYILSVIRSAKGYHTIDEHFFTSAVYPPTAVVVASYNEDPEIMEETLVSVSNLDYPAKKLYLLDDSTNQKLRQRIEDLGKRYGFVYVHRENRRGYKGGAINDLMGSISEKYMAVFDADQKPVPNFLSQTVSLLEENPKLAFVQTPQFYHNTERNAIAFGSAYQQVVFYEYICEGKNVSNAMFSCGSNVVYNVEALRSVGGFEEKFVTEDFATGLKFHMHGWKSLYYNYVYVYGLGPESLPAYFTQQMRWALGTIGIFKKMLAYMLRKPRALKLEQWWEYSLSGSYYGVGWVNFILMLCPIAFLLFDIRPLIAEPRFYIAAFLPYFIFAMSTFYFSMRQRGYKVRSLLVGQSLNFSTFWVLMNAAIMVLFNIKRPFGVTPKGVVGKLKLKYLLPHILLITVSAAAIAAGIDKFLEGYGWAILINVLWAFYHICVLSMVFYFNRKFKPHEWKPVYAQTH